MTWRPWRVGLVPCGEGLLHVEWAAIIGRRLTEPEKHGGTRLTCPNRPKRYCRREPKPCWCCQSTPQPPSRAARHFGSRSQERSRLEIEIRRQLPEHRHGQANDYSSATIFHFDVLSHARNIAANDSGSASR
jgi:hypothetical protein